MGNPEYFESLAKLESARKNSLLFFCAEFVPTIGLILCINRIKEAWMFIPVVLILVYIFFIVMILKNILFVVRFICPRCGKKFFFSASKDVPQPFPLGKIKKCVNCGLQRHTK
jgi:predicted RNA-binding Zn-ribbon protein involved in translation (DUF1610 family)